MGDEPGSVTWTRGLGILGASGVWRQAPGVRTDTAFIRGPCERSESERSKACKSQGKRYLSEGSESAGQMKETAKRSLVG